MTRVSSESSSARTVVVPSASAASSSTRLEMLLEPGRRTVPAAATKGGRSRKAVENMGSASPLRAGAARRLDRFLEGLRIACGEQRLELHQRLAKGLRLEQHLLAIGQQ